MICLHFVSTLDKFDFFVLIFIIYITAQLLTDSHLHMPEEEKNHLINCFPINGWKSGGANQFVLHSFLFTLFLV